MYREYFIEKILRKKNEIKMLEYFSRRKGKTEIISIVNSSIRKKNKNKNCEFNLNRIISKWNHHTRWFSSFFHNFNHSKRIFSSYVKHRFIFDRSQFEKNQSENFTWWKIFQILVSQLKRHILENNSTRVPQWLLRWYEITFERR